jgi:pyruvate/2-oxoglutarate dehydrogenase complex dihydrolipoamide dehydrogenase (E3) component
VIPYAVFTDPQVARVGLSELEAKALGVPYEVAILPFGHIARAREANEKRGLIKVLVNPETDRLVGATIVGSQAGELIHVYAVLVQADASVRALVDAEMVHPTFSEGLQTAVMKLKRYALG